MLPYYCFCCYFWEIILHILSVYVCFANMAVSTLICQVNCWNILKLLSFLNQISCHCIIVTIYREQTWNTLQRPQYKSKGMSWPLVLPIFLYAVFSNIFLFLLKKNLKLIQVWMFLLHHYNIFSLHYLNSSLLFTLWNKGVHIVHNENVVNSTGNIIYYFVTY